MSWNKGQQANLNPQQKAYGRQAGLIRKKASISQPLPPRTWQPASHWLSFWRLVYLFSYCFVFCFEHISGGFDLFVTDRTCLSWWWIFFPMWPAWFWSLTLAVGCMSCGHHRAIRFEVVDAIQEHNAIFQDHSDILTKGTGTHAIIMAVKHIIVKALPLLPYHY